MAPPPPDSPPPTSPLRPLAARALSSPTLRTAVETAAARLADGTAPGGGRVSVAGLTPEGKGLWLALLLEAVGRPLVVASVDDAAAARLARATRAFARAPERVLYFPAPSLSPYQGVSTSLRVKREELADLDRLARGEADLVIASGRSLARPLPTRADFRERTIALAGGVEIAPEELAARLSAAGYTKVDLVVEPGDFARRGGLVDLFPASSDRPVRVDFFGDFVDSIRFFDVDTQRSEEAVTTFSATPFSLFDLPRGRAALAAEMESFFSGPDWGAAAADRDAKIAALRDGRGFPGEEHLIPAALLPGVGWTDLCGFAGAPLVVDEPDGLVENAERYDRLLDEERESLVANRKAALPRERLSRPVAEIRDAVRGAAVHVAGLALEEKGATTLRLAAPATPVLRDRLPDWGREAGETVRRGELLVVAAAERGTLERFRRLLGENEIAPRDGFDGAPPDAGAVLVVADLEAGFSLPDAAFTLSAGPDAFAPVLAAAPSKRKGARAFVSDLRDLKPGDVVVHSEHGLGRFVGISTLTFEGVVRESLEIAYEGGGKLLLPPDRLDQLQKYSAFGAEPPRLDRLGGSTFARSKKAVRKAARAIADDLLKLYAERATTPGFAFSRDSPWQREFEDAFEFTPTPDQETAFKDTKKDMEADRPMDRLIVGDVGYGKTEVAMRAAFKAVLDGKQVAVLAPTTLLAYQHFRTFRRRFASFPVSIEMLSRFRSAAAQKALAKRIGEGNVDVVVGTHRLLAKDVAWKDLGLLVVDEEQRFGVAQKEKLKTRTLGVDVLTLSATPIPRTLSMSLSGIRDMSVIETPPRDRLAVETRVAPFDPELIREAVAAEVERGGQVFFIHNRVGSMEGMRQYLERLLPGVRIAVGHGQMGEGALESAISAFIDRQYDLLLATTIVENGIDIPNCNTMLVSRADRFGLAQLYQLRGRVGRSDRLAHCYLLVPPDRSMTEEARLRLAALQEFSDLGAGFRIAARDLEIRGAGEILGAEQSGQIAAVGFETYCRLLEEAIAEARGVPPPPSERTSVNLGFSASIPRGYISEDGLRLSIYKRIAEADAPEEVEAMAAELEDRFGERPTEVNHLLGAARLRVAAAALGLSSVDRTAGRLHLKFGTGERRVPLERVVDLVQRLPGASLAPDGSLSIPAREAGPALLERALGFVADLAGAGGGR